MTRTLQILEKLVSFPTVSRDSNLALIDWVQNLLTDAGFHVIRIWSPDRNKAGLFARFGPEIEGGVCLSAHTDVVPIDGQEWTRPPFQLTDEGARVYGRGTTDMKGFLASALALAERAGGMRLMAPLTLSISYDEEIGCVGIQHMMPELKTLIGTPRVVIVGEPTSMQVAIGHKGKTALNVTCNGQAGHSALAPEFVNAIHVAAAFVGKMQDFQDTLTDGPSDSDYTIPFSTVHIGKINGGTALNIVPSEVQMAMEFRHLTQISADDLSEQIENIAARVSATFAPALPITIETVNSYPGLNTDTSDAAVDLARELAGSVKTLKVPFGTEAGFFSEIGQSTGVIGPGDMARDGHQPDEGLCKSQLAACDEMMNRIAGYLSS